MQITHKQFMDTFTHEMRGMYQSNINQEVIILGAVSLFWQHSKNIAYLNHAMQYARASRGIRVNAVRAFLSHFTGAVWKKDKYIGGGRKLKECPEEFNNLNKWTEWANEHAAEPAYDHKAFVMSIEKYLSKKKEEATENGDNSTAEILGTMVAMAKRAEA